MFFRGYFSEAVVNIITTQAKLSSNEYIGTIIKEEVNKGNYEFFYDSVSTDGVVYTSFDMNKANLLLANTMISLKEISDNYNSAGEFTVYVPISYLLIPSAYFFPNIKLTVEASNLLYYDAKLKTDVVEYGINSSLVSLYLTINISYQVMVPLMFEIVDNTIDIPLAVKVINGKVPEVLLDF